MTWTFELAWSALRVARSIMRAHQVVLAVIGCVALLFASQRCAAQVRAGIDAAFARDLMPRLAPNPLATSTSSEPERRGTIADLGIRALRGWQGWWQRRLPAPRRQAGTDLGGGSGARQLLEANAIAKLECKLGLLIGQQVSDIAEFVGDRGFPRWTPRAHRTPVGPVAGDHLPRAASGGLALRSPKRECKEAYVK